MMPPVLRRFAARLQWFLTELYVSPYRGAIARARRDEDDLFMLLVFIDLLIIVAAVFVMLEAASAFMRESRGSSSPEPTPAG